MAQTRFEQLPKKDREAIQQYVAMRPEINDDTSCLFQRSRDILRNNIAGLSTRPVRSDYVYKSAAGLFAARFYFLAAELLQRGIAKRLLTDSPKALAESLFAASRLQYLDNLAKTPAYSGGYDCLHVFDLLLSLAASDTPAIEAYTRRYSSISKQGHPFTRLLCNSVSAILTNRQDDSLVEQLTDRKETGYNKAMLSAVAAIIQCNAQQVTAHLEEMLAGHRRKTINDGLLRYFAVPVHGLFNLASRHFRDTGARLPAKPISPLWDEEVHVCVLQAESSEYLQYFGIVSPEVALWARELPTALPDEAFVLSDG